MRFSDHVVIFSYKYSALGINLYSHLITSSDLYLDTDLFSQMQMSVSTLFYWVICVIILMTWLCLHYINDMGYIVVVISACNIIIIIFPFRKTKHNHYFVQLLYFYLFFIYYIHIPIYVEPVTIFSHTICRFLKKDHIWEWSSSSPFDHVEDWLHVVTLYDVEPFQNPESDWTIGCLPAWCRWNTLTCLWAVVWVRFLHWL